jgi:hypothetical protein
LLRRTRNSPDGITQIEDNTHPEDSILYLMSSDGAGLLENVAESAITGPVPTAIGPGPRRVSAGDFNDDGQSDVFFGIPGPEKVCGDGTFRCWPGGQDRLLLSDMEDNLVDVTSTHLPELNNFTHGQAVADFDGDGDLDIYVNNLSNNRDPHFVYPTFSYLMFNDGEGRFEVVADWSAGDHWSGDPPIVGHNGRFPPNIQINAWWPTAIDADGDGDQDIYLGEADIWEDCRVLNPCNDYVHETLLINDGTGRFELQEEDPVPSSELGDIWGRIYIQASFAYDLNLDGLDDMILHQLPAVSLGGPGGVTDHFNTYLQFLISNGDGTFRDETALRYPGRTSQGSTSYFQMRDIDGDGHKDILNSRNALTPDIRINDGEGIFRPLPEDWIDIGDQWVALDVDGDGGTDFLRHQWNGYWLYKMTLPYGAELDGTDESDYLIGGAWDNIYRGLEGDDVLDGGLGNDHLDGGPGNDTLIGGKGADRYVYHAADLAGHDTISDKAGNADRLQFEDFGLNEVTLASQGANGELILSFADGGSITIENHFQGGTADIEKLVVDGQAHDISTNPAFQGGPIQSLLGAFVMDAGLNGNWWNGPARSGEGAQIEIADAGNGSSVFVATVYSYDTMGNQIFLVAVGPVSGDTAEVEVFITDGGVWGDDFDPALISEMQWGTGTFTADSCESINMALMPNAEFQGMGYTNVQYDLIRLTTPAVSCPIESAN